MMFRIAIIVSACVSIAACANRAAPAPVENRNESKPLQNDNPKIVVKPVPSAASSLPAQQEATVKTAAVAPAIASAAKPLPLKPANLTVDSSHPGTHTVQKGETLYSIALAYDLDYRELAQWN